MSRSTEEGASGPVFLSVVSPAFNEAKNLPLLFERLATALSGLRVEWEWIVVDDHSSDATFLTVVELARRDSRVRGFRLARNSGSHAAIGCGLAHAKGTCAAVLAADLQDPPECLGPLLDKWRAGAQVVWAVRQSRDGEDAGTVRMAGVYYWIMRRIVGMTEMPSTGADFFLLDRMVVNALKTFPEKNVSILGLITWMGFRQDSILYRKESRLHGSSGWTLRKKLKLLVDSVTSFSYVPIRAMSFFGIATAVLGFAYAAVVIVNSLLGRPAAGWSSLMVVVLVVGGMQMVMMGVLGEYVWRGLDEARRRPHYIVEASVGDA